MSGIDSDFLIGFLFFGFIFFRFLFYGYIFFGFTGFFGFLFSGVATNAIPVCQPSTLAARCCRGPANIGSRPSQPIRSGSGRRRRQPQAIHLGNGRATALLLRRRAIVCGVGTVVDNSRETIVREMIAPRS